MNYKKIYKNLYLKAKSRNFKEFKEENMCIENHHFLPKSIFNLEKTKKILCDLLEVEHNNIDDNILPLTCKEHYIAHLLLWKIFKKEKVLLAEAKMAFALKQMNSRYKGSKNYENFKSKFYMSGLNVINVTDLKTNERKSISKDEFYNNKDRYKHISKDTVTVFDKIENKSKRIDKEEYYNNKDRYISPITNTIGVFDKIENKNKRIPSEEYYNNKDRYLSLMTNTITVFDKTKNVYKNISSEEYYNNKDRYRHANSNKILVKNIETDENLWLEKELFDKNKYRKISMSKGKVYVKNKITNEIIYIDVNEYHNNKDKYISPSANTVTVFDKLENKNKRIPPEEYYNNKDRYISTAANTVSVLDKLENKNKRISKKEYYNNKGRYKASGGRLLYSKKLRKNVLVGDDYNYEDYLIAEGKKSSIINYFKLYDNDKLIFKDDITKLKNFCKENNLSCPLLLKTSKNKKAGNFEINKNNNNKFFKNTVLNHPEYYIEKIKVKKIKEIRYDDNLNKIVKIYFDGEIK